MNYWTPVKKQAFSRTITGLLTSGNFRYYLGLSPARFRALPDGVGFIWAGLSQRANELLDTGEKASLLENNNWVANVWGFPLLRGSVAR